MTVLLGALVFLGRALLILLLVVLVLAAVLLVVPVGIAVRWTPAAGAAVQGCLGPVRMMLYPRRKKKDKKQAKASPPDQGAAPAPAATPVQAPSAPPEQSDVPKPAPQTKAEQETRSAAKKPVPEPPVTPLPDAQQDEPGTNERDALLETGKILFRTLVPHRARLLRGVEVRKLTVFWTVTGEDAADTAVAYGRRMALANNLLVLARQYLNIRADSLRMEPDFTGQMAEKRIFSCQIRTRPYIILLILFYLMRRNEQGRIPLKMLFDQLGTLA